MSVRRTVAGGISISQVLVMLGLIAVVTVVLLPPVDPRCSASYTEFPADLRSIVEKQSHRLKFSIPTSWARRDTEDGGVYYLRDGVDVPSFRANASKVEVPGKASHQDLVAALSSAVMSQATGVRKNSLGYGVVQLRGPAHVGEAEVLKVQWGLAGYAGPSTIAICRFELLLHSANAMSSEDRAELLNFEKMIETASIGREIPFTH